MKQKWFRNKKYGWGWIPAKKEGWYVTFIFLGLYFISGMLFSEFCRQTPSKVMEYVWLYVSWIVLLTGLFIFICLKTGEKPRWRWGD